MSAPKNIQQALDQYAGTVARRAYWEDNGRRGDGLLEEAQREERAARATVDRLIADAFQAASRAAGRQGLA